MQEFELYGGNDLVNYVLKSSNIKELLTNKKFINYIMKPENHYAFVWLIYGMENNKELINIFLNKNFLDEILLDERAKDKYNAIISSVPFILENASDKVIQFLLSKSDLYFLFRDINLVVANKMLDYILLNDNSKLFVLANLPSNVQEGLFNPSNMEKILKMKMLEKCYWKFSPGVIVKLFEQEKYRDLILNSQPEVLLALSSKFKRYELPSFIQKDKALIDKISSIENPSLYRNIIKNFCVSNYELVENVENKRKDYVSALIVSINEDGIFEEYIKLREYIKKYGYNKKVMTVLPAELRLNQTDNESLKKLTFKRLFENICDLYFKDYPNNVLLNLNQIINFINETKLEIIPYDRRVIYELIIHFDKLSLNAIKVLNKKISLLNSLDFLLYNDLRNCKDKSYELFNDSFIKLSEHKELEDEESSLKYNTKVYKLDGEDFTACVHVGEVYKDYANKMTISLSIIGTDNIGVFNDNNIIVGFSKFKVDKIMHMYNADSYTSNQYGTNRVNKIYTPKTLLKETSFYNEVLYSEMDGEVLFPDYVVCKDEIDDESVQYAQKYNLPILIINTKKYKTSYKREDEENYQECAYDSVDTDYFGGRKR